ncbi:Glycosyl transferase family 25 protein [Pleurostoma richardsiae]|uniref:Glycosyl transferase family 25 protein n=1 Tax=Pleurostoma richardsiae TaxID=41990 RepID=A0AA38RUF6_9PEZI|nr:Glycosyl transferase family 25 protein [Pleurostoma richardsiae]
MRAAGNRTLGFHSIRFINMKSRYDRQDAAVIQAYLSGIDLQDAAAVDGATINAVGLPPTSNDALKPGEKGCFRAHANIWSEVVQKRLPPVLVIESDATWDVNLRPIVALLNKHFTDLLRNMAVRPLYGEHAADNETAPLADDTGRSDAADPWWQPVDHRAPPLQPPPYLAEADADDPWHSDYWDLLSFGHCFDLQKAPNRHIRYADPWVPAGKDYFGHQLGVERVVHQSGGTVCTTAYAVTQRGAAKLLLRMALDLDMPIDLIMQSMIANGELTAYSTIPTVMAQWHYKPNLGMEYRGANSDIQGTMVEALSGDNAPTMDGWEEAKSSKSVWMSKPSHPDAAFSEMALKVAWERIFSNEKDISVELG